jgi:type IV pilus assembly protein PilB
MSFARALRAILRQDPDVVMIGEIRDLETAEIAIKAAQTGHMVMSTLHTNSAPETQHFYSCTCFREHHGACLRTLW